MATRLGTNDLDLRTPDRDRDRRDDDRRTRTYTETKLGTKTTEFYVMILAIVGIVVATYVDSGDTLTKDDGIRYAAFVAVAYIVSRGLAKLGTREPYNAD
jgi:hypothetical protein